MLTVSVCVCVGIWVVWVWVWVCLCYIYIILVDVIVYKNTFLHTFQANKKLQLEYIYIHCIIWFLPYCGFML